MRMRAHAREVGARTQPGARDSAAIHQGITPQAQRWGGAIKHTLLRILLGIAWDECQVAKAARAGATGVEHPTPGTLAPPQDVCSTEVGGIPAGIVQEREREGGFDIGQAHGTCGHVLIHGNSQVPVAASRALAAIVFQLQAVKGVAPEMQLAHLHHRRRAHHLPDVAHDLQPRRAGHQRDDLVAATSLRFRQYSHRTWRARTRPVGQQWSQDLIKYINSSASQRKGGWPRVFIAQHHPT